MALAIGIRVSEPIVFVGMLIGGALPWLFSSFCIQAVSRAASLIVEEVRRQFKAGVLEGKVKPDYRARRSRFPPPRRRRSSSVWPFSAS